MKIDNKILINTIQENLKITYMKIIMENFIIKPEIYFKEILKKDFEKVMEKYLNLKKVVISKDNLKMI